MCKRALYWIISGRWQKTNTPNCAKLGIRKETTRFLLPNAAETRIVTSMNFAGWSHFFWLRAVDEAAQWKISRHGATCVAHVARNCSPGYLPIIQHKIEKLSEAENK